MTREQAIEELSILLNKYQDSATGDAIDMAIDALSAESSEDTISRQAVEEIINDIRDCISVEGYCAILERLNKLPSVNPQDPSDISNDGTLTVNVEDGRKISRVLVCGANHWGGLYYPDEQEPKTGHWIIHGEPPINVIECSECGQKYHNHYFQPLAHFCSMCGAKMESEDDKE